VYSTQCADRHKDNTVWGPTSPLDCQTTICPSHSLSYCCYYCLRLLVCQWTICSTNRNNHAPVKSFFSLAFPTDGLLGKESISLIFISHIITPCETHFIASKLNKLHRHISPINIKMVSQSPYEFKSPFKKRKASKASTIYSYEEYLDSFIV